MLQPTVQSRIITLTEDEKEHLAKATDDDLQNFAKDTERARKRHLTMTKNGLTFIDFYTGMQSEGKQYIYDVSVDLEFVWYFWILI